MQYLLSEEEYNNLSLLVEKAKRLPDQKDLQEICTLLADNMVLKEGWQKGHIWGCILTHEGENYCDECPAQKVCPYEYKSWSK